MATNLKVSHISKNKTVNVDEKGGNVVISLTLKL